MQHALLTVSLVMLVDQGLWLSIRRVGP